MGPACGGLPAGGEGVDRGRYDAEPALMAVNVGLVEHALRPVDAVRAGVDGEFRIAGHETDHAAPSGRLDRQLGLFITKRIAEAPEDDSRAAGRTFGRIQRIGAAVWIGQQPERWQAPRRSRFQAQPVGLLVQAAQFGRSGIGHD